MIAPDKMSVLELRMNIIVFFTDSTKLIKLLFWCCSTVSFSSSNLTQMFAKLTMLSAMYNKSHQYVWRFRAGCFHSNIVELRSRVLRSRPRSTRSTSNQFLVKFGKLIQDMPWNLLVVKLQNKLIKWLLNYVVYFKSRFINLFKAFWKPFFTASLN